MRAWRASDIPDAIVVMVYARRSEALRVALTMGKPLPGAPHVEIARVSGAPEAIATKACERAHKRGLIEYGASLASGVLTDKGRELLASVDKQAA